MEKQAGTEITRGHRIAVNYLYRCFARRGGNRRHRGPVRWATTEGSLDRGRPPAMGLNII